jgi:hypothetical protein
MMKMRLGKRRQLQGTISGKSDREPLGCCAWPKTPWTMHIAVVHNIGTRRHLCDEIQNKCGLREEIHDVPDPQHEGK